MSGPAAPASLVWTWHGHALCIVTPCSAVDAARVRAVQQLQKKLPRNKLAQTQGLWPALQMLWHCFAQLLRLWLGLGVLIWTRN